MGSAVRLAPFTLKESVQKQLSFQNHITRASPKSTKQVQCRATAAAR